MTILGKLTRRFNGANFKVIDLGVDVPLAKFVAAIKGHQPQVLDISSLLTTNMPAMKATVMTLNAAGMSEAKTILGGVPVSKKNADEILSAKHVTKSKARYKQHRSLPTRTISRLSKAAYQDTAL